jgi:nitrate reductase NapE component
MQLPTPQRNDAQPREVRAPALSPVAALSALGSFGVWMLKFLMYGPPYPAWHAYIIMLVCNVVAFQISIPLVASLVCDTETAPSDQSISMGRALVVLAALGLVVFSWIA